jgi:hypothetical protein
VRRCPRFRCRDNWHSLAPTEATRKTIKKVMIVVPVLMTSCHVSLNPNKGPVTSQTRMTLTAKAKVRGLPVR